MKFRGAPIIRKGPRFQVSRRRSSLVVLLVLGALFAAPIAVAHADARGVWSRAAPRSVESQLAAIAKSGGAKTLKSSPGTEFELRASREIAEAVLASGNRSITPVDKSWARLILYLRAPAVRKVLEGLGSSRGHSRSGKAAARPLLRKIMRTAAVRQLRQEGAKLRRHPARLRRLISEFLRGTHRSSEPATVPEGNPFATVDSLLGDPSEGANHKSPVEATRELLESPQAVAYLRSLPAVSLGMIAGSSSGAGGSAAASASDATEGENPSCTEAQGRAQRSG
jgi:hypothetical protein